MSSTLTKADLLLTPEKFSQIACLDGGAFGVKTSCDVCSQQLNGCMRQLLLDALIANQARAEMELGWLLTDRYVSETVYIKGKRRFQLRYPGVAALNVAPHVQNLSTLPVIVYVHTNLPTQVINGVCAVEVDGDYIDDPDKAVVRNPKNGAIIRHVKTEGFPSLTPLGNWLIALDADCANLPTVNVHHCSYAFALSPSLPICGGKLQLVTPDGEYVPLAKPVLNTPNGWLFVFNWWSIVKPAFSASKQIIDLSSAQPDWYKFETDVTVRCVVDADQEPEIISSDDGCGCDPATIPELKLVSPERGIVEIDSPTCRRPCPLHVRIYYRVSPDFVGGGAINWLGSIMEALAYLTAAELPLEVCGCKTETGFIHLAQQIYAEQRIGMSGDVVTNIRYGSRHGQFIYAERMSRVYHFRRRIVL